MNIRKLIFLILIFIGGIIFYGFYNNLIIIRFPNQLNLNNIQKSNHKKLINFFYWQDNKWHIEDSEIIWADLTENINNILVNWLSINYEFNKNLKQASVQTVMLDPEKNFAYISFDKNPLSKQWSIYQKIKFIESILKTLNENKIKIQGVYFLVNHKFLEDTHLDFCHFWPISGYNEAA